MDDRPAPRVTRIRAAGRGGRRQQVELDDGSAFELSTATWLASGLRAGDALDDGRLAELQAADAREQAHEAALRLLSYRSRSEKEIVDRLAQKGIPPAIAEAEVARLRRAGLLDDTAFARVYVEDRARLSPRGSRLLRQELRARGVEARVASEAAAGVDELETALALARTRCRGETATRYDLFRSRVGGFLQRRGFAYDVISEALRTVWQEIGGRGEDGVGDPAAGPDIL